MKPTISVSIVSHMQGALVADLLADIEHFCVSEAIRVILILNVAEELPFDTERFSFAIHIHRNNSPQGFAANHNEAFSYSDGEYFCVMNPDIRLDRDPFQSLIQCLKDSSIGVAAPMVVGESNEVEDSARKFPTPFKIICKAFGKCKGSDYLINDTLVFPDWVGGMFMLFPRSVFEKLGGFDSRYFLYYEDVDLCARLRLAGYEVTLCPDAQVIHHAHRSSHRNVKYLKWHLASMLRFFCSPVYWRVQCKKWL